jgi:Asp/Glu/hydantoin racemase
MYLEVPMIYYARKQQTGYGQPIGILLLEEHIPCPPGTLGNPTTFSHPVCYEIVAGVGSASLSDPRDGADAQAFIAAGRALVERGACAVAGNCGLMIVHQESLARALDVPVLLSSLLQLPWIGQMLGPSAVIGVIASSRMSLTEAHLRIAAAGSEIRTAVATMDGKEHFRSAIGDQSGELDFDRVQAEVIEVAKALVWEHPAVKAILFECVDLPPYAHAVQQAVGLPVFDMTTLIGHVHSALVRRPFVGVY